MARLKDIANHLGLSVTQVSRALNGHSDVSEATRTRVAAAARALGYSANLPARSLRSGRSGIVAMVVEAEAERDLPDVLVASVIGLSAEFSRRGMQFVLHVTTAGESIVEAHRRLMGSGLIDGFVVVNPAPDDPRIALLGEHGVAFVVHGRDRPTPGYGFVDLDNRAVGARLATHLSKQGHRRLALVDGPSGSAFAVARHQGVSAMLAATGSTCAQVARFSGPMTEATGLAAIDALFADDAVHPTAIIAGNTMLAAGLYQGLARRGLNVPGTVSIVAHDDHLPRVASDGFSPPLTVTRSPLADAWPPLADALVAAIDGAPPDAHQTVLAPDFVARGSVAAPARRPSAAD